MRASVIIPAYNASQTLGAALNSVLDQQLPPYEVIVVDDGSTDQTSEVAAAYQDRLPIKLIQQKNQGLGAARNTGMNAAQGTHWAFLDADDLWSWNKLAAAQRTFQNHPNLKWLYTPVFEWDANTDHLRLRSCSPINSQRDFLLTNPIVPSTVVMSTDVDFSWEEDRELQEDVGAYLRLLHHGIWPIMQTERTTKYRADFGMTSDVEHHVAQVMRAVEKSVRAGHISQKEFDLYRVRKSYELARTYQKRGEEKKQTYWKKQALEQATCVKISLGLRLRMRCLL